MTFERTTTATGIEYRLGPRIRFEQPLMDANPDVAVHLDTSLQVFAASLAAVESIATDARLSEIGRQERREPVLAEGISHLAGAWWAVDNYEQGIASREAALFRVPGIEPTHSVAALADREVRDYFRGLPPGERLAMLATMQKDPAAHERVQIAMLRSPIALLEQEARLLRQVWQDAKRAANPGEAAAIEWGRQSVEWTRRGLSQAAALYKTVNHLSDEHVLRTVLTDENPRRATGFGVFGFDARQAENFGLRLKRQGWRPSA